MPKLNKWFLLQIKTPDGTSAFVLTGLTENDPRHPDNSHLTTSAIKELNLPARTAQTANTLYDLGEPHPEYTQWLEEQNYTLIKKLGTSNGE